MEPAEPLSQKKISIQKRIVLISLPLLLLAAALLTFSRFNPIPALTGGQPPAEEISVERVILDEDGIYDPAHFNDRLLLGLKGTMSEAELHMLRARLRGGILSKARRGELHCKLPIGLVYDGANRVALDPDIQVQESIRLIFATFERTGAGCATVRHFTEQKLLFPLRPNSGPHRTHTGPTQGESWCGSASASAAR